MFIADVADKTKWNNLSQKSNCLDKNNILLYVSHHTFISGIQTGTNSSLRWIIILAKLLLYEMSSHTVNKMRGGSSKY